MAEFKMDVKELTNKGYTVPIYDDQVVQVKDANVIIYHRSNHTDEANVLKSILCTQTGLNTDGVACYWLNLKGTIDQELSKEYAQGRTNEPFIINLIDAKNEQLVCFSLIIEDKQIGRREQDGSFAPLTRVLKDLLPVAK